MSTANPMAPAPAASVPAAKPTTIKGWLQSDGLKSEIAKALPKHCSAERMARIAITAVTRTPKLAECDPSSFMQCLLDLSQWGLEPNGRDAHLIPFNNRKRNVVECQLIIDFKGLVQLLYRSGKVRYIHADVVREGDDFDFTLGQVARHSPHSLRRDADMPAEAGNVLGAYCIVELIGNAVKCEWMSKEEIDGIRARSKAKNSSPWVTDYNEMAKKTVFRRACKWLPLSAEVVDAFERDDDRLASPANAPQQPAISSLDELTKQLAPPPTEDESATDVGEELPPQPPPPMSEEEKAEILAEESREQDAQLFENKPKSATEAGM